MDAPVRVLLADDHPVFRTELRQLLAEAPRIEVVGEAADGDEALAAVQTLRPDVAILDLEMPRKDGLEVARAVRNLGLSTKVVLLTVHKSQALVTKAVECGVTGYVLKDDAFGELLECVRAVHAGRPYFSSSAFALPAVVGEADCRRGKADQGPGRNLCSPRDGPN